MTAATGQIFRFLGLFLEAVGVIGVLAARRGQLDSWKAKGVDPNLVLPLVFIAGFAIWVVGTWTIRRQRLRERDELI